MKKLVVLLLLLSMASVGCSSAPTTGTERLEEDIKDVILESMTFDLTTGDQIELMDLFKGPDFDPTLDSVLTQKVEKMAIKLSTDFTGGSEGRGYYLKDKSLVVFYNAPTYTDINVGPLEIEAPFEDLKDVLKDGISSESGTYTVDSKSEEDKSGKSTISITYPVVSNISDKAVEDKINAFIKTRTDIYKELVIPDPEAEEDLKVAYEVTSKSKDKLSIKVTITILTKPMKNDADGQKQSSNIMDEYNKILNEKTKPFEALFFVDKNIKSLSKEQAATMILSFEEIQENFISQYEDKLFKDPVQNSLIDIFEYNFNKNRINEIKDKELNSLLKEIIDGGYMVINVEGSFMPVQDYTVLEKYSENLPDDIGDYIKIKAHESLQLKELNMNSLVSWDGISERITELEGFIGNYPESIKESAVNKHYLYYLYQYLFGFDNMPAFNYETNKIDEKLVESYKRFISDNTNSETSKMIGDYLAMVESSGYVLNDEIDNYRKRVTEGYGE